MRLSTSQGRTMAIEELPNRDSASAARNSISEAFDVSMVPSPGG